MTSPEAECAERRPYDTVNRRLEAWTERIRERYNRTPTTNELLAIDHLPCLPSTRLFDQSDSGIIIYQRLRYAEKTGNPSLLEEAGRLLMLQMTNAWTPAMSANGNLESCSWETRNDSSDGVRRLNRVFLQQYLERQDCAPLLQEEQSSCNITYPDSAGSRTITGEHLPFRNQSSSINIEEGNSSRVPSPSRAVHQDTFNDIFSSPSAIPGPVPQATTINSLSTASSPCPTPSTTTSSPLSYQNQANTQPATQQKPTNPVLQAHSINGNTYIIPITLHFANTVSNSSIAVQIPGIASAIYPLDLISGQREGVPQDIGLSAGAAGARSGGGDGNGSECSTTINYGSVRALGHNGEEGEVRVEVRLGEGGEPIGAVGREWVGQGQGQGWGSREWEG